jgi:magnesium transporter
MLRNPACEAAAMAKKIGWRWELGHKRETVKEQSAQEQLHIETITWGELTWVNVNAPTERETQWLEENYHFHQLALDDCLSRKQISKIDTYPGYLFFIFHYPLYDKATRIATKRQWSAFIGENFLVTINTGDMKTLNALFRDCQANEDSRREYLGGGSGFLLYRLLDRTVDSYFPVLDKILSLIEDVEDAVFDEEVEAAREISVLRRDIITQRAVFFPTRAIFVEMENKLKRFSKTDVTAYYNDLMDHINKICDTLDEAKELIEVFSDTDYTLATHRINRVSRLLTIFSTVFLPFLIVSSLYGMNIVLPGGTDRGSYHTFIILLVIMGAVAGGMLYIFHRRRWI